MTRAPALVAPALVALGLLVLTGCSQPAERTPLEQAYLTDVRDPTLASMGVDVTTISDDDLIYQGQLACDDLRSRKYTMQEMIAAATGRANNPEDAAAIFWTADRELCPDPK